MNAYGKGYELRSAENAFNAAYDGLQDIEASRQNLESDLLRVMEDFHAQHGCNIDSDIHGATIDLSYDAAGKVSNQLNEIMDENHHAVPSKQEEYGQCQL